MEERDRTLLDALDRAIEALLVSEIPPEIDCAGCSSEELAALGARVNRLIRAFAEARPFLLSLSEGRLETDVPARNFLVSPFKQLHANLRHLTWQTKQITRGDLSQQVNFLGEFSTSFNAMIAALREKKSIEEALARSEKKLKDITSVLGEGVYVLDEAGGLVFMNPEAERLLGWSEAELLAKNVHDTIHFQRADGTRVACDNCPAFTTIRSGKTCRVHDDVFTRKDGTLIPVAFVSTPVRDKGVLTGAVVVFHDITAQKRSQEALQRANQLLSQQATTDPLTGAANRLKFDVALGQEINRAKRHLVPLSLAILDIDHFKAINDRFGHHAGDLVLQELARMGQSGLRSGDGFFRWGGEEFAILLPHTELAGARIVAERLRERIEQSRFSGVERVTCSFGVAQFKAGDDEKIFLERADRALYRAKESGRNRVEIE